MICEDTYIETIIVPCNYRVTMPLGVKCSRNSVLYARIYEGSRLYNIIEDVSQAGIYTVSRATLFYESLGRLLDEKLVKDYSEECFVIKGAEHYRIKVKITDITRKSNYKIIEMKPVNPEIAFNQIESAGYSRADGCLLEILVRYTKMRAGVITAEDYCMYYNLCGESVKRSTRNPEYLKVLEEIKCQS